MAFSMCESYIWGFGELLSDNKRYTCMKFNKEKKTKTKNLQSELLSIFSSNPKKQFDIVSISKKLRGDSTKDGLMSAIQALIEAGSIIALRAGKFRFNPNVTAGSLDVRQPKGNAKNDKASSKYEIGRVDMTRTGAAYIICEGDGGDIFVQQSGIKNAMHGDTVKVLCGRSGRNGKRSGEVVEIVSRGSTMFLGILEISKQFAFVRPDNDRVNVDIYVPLKDLNGAQDGDMVMAEVQKWHGEKGLKSPIGIIRTILGKPGGNDIEMRAILLKNGFDIEFPPLVEKESEQLDKSISEAEIGRRRDMRSVTTFTIDPLTAKDFDDAISIQKLPEGGFEIGVHIADVSHYVKPGTQIDLEAYRRSTSVYLVDRVAPMLPEELSNGVCSLRPNEDKLCFAAIFHFTEGGKLTGKPWFGRTVIHSNRRFTYEEAQEALETSTGDFVEELLTLNDFAKKMRAERYKKGAISFEAPEVYFKLDATGKPIEVHTKERKDAHMLIEDFMLLANREVAQFIFKKPNTPFVYRIHDLPDQDKLADLALFAKPLGYKLEFTNPLKVASSINQMMLDASGKPEIDVLTQIAVRCMAKAVYSTDNIGHYGLGFEWYTHFTSPIRRYSDVLVHRILEENLAGKPTKRVKDDLETQCKYISSQERKATECERESIKYKQVEFIKEHIGEEFEGIISGIAPHGVFIELRDSRCEGRITFDKFSEAFDVQALYIKGMRTNKIYRMGDLMRVKIVDADLKKRLIDMEPA